MVFEMIGNLVASVSFGVRLSEVAQVVLVCRCSTLPSSQSPATLQAWSLGNLVYDTRVPI